MRLEGDDQAREAIDLSCGGLFVKGLTTLAPGTALTIELALERDRLTTRAVVRWIRAVPFTPAQPDGTGLAFEDLSDEQQSRILAEVERETP